MLPVEWEVVQMEVLVVHLMALAEVELHYFQAEQVAQLG
jgi:hypothetical protein